MIKEENKFKMKLQDPTIVVAEDKDAIIAAWLMYLAFDEFSQYLFGTTELRKIQKYFRELWISRRNRLSHRYSYVMRNVGKPVALISCYEGDLVNKLLIPSFFSFIRINPGLIKYIFTHINYLLSIVFTPEAQKDEFYIFMLAVLPEYQNKGLGSKLLAFAEEQARAKNFSKISLLTSKNNVNAIRFYERNGYQKVVLFDRPPLNNYKMVKELA